MLSLIDKKNENLLRHIQMNKTITQQNGQQYKIGNEQKSKAELWQFQFECFEIPLCMMIFLLFFR